VTVRAVLFDVGGPLNTELEHERFWDAEIRAEFADAGFAPDDTAFAAACRWAVECFAPDTYQAIIWRLAGDTGGNESLVQRVSLRFRETAEDPERRISFQLRDGIPALLQRLHGRGLALGLAANQPQSTIDVLDRIGIGGYFRHREVSGSHGFRKPDVRLFLRACADLGVEPPECIMVGDRIDNDIVPARLLGMRTVLLRSGRHIKQQPRSSDEVPDAEVRDVAGMETAIVRLCKVP
jgi:putative hydrolase of the HAD superfamily